MPPEPVDPAIRTTALVSGGKDSIYAAYLASTQGWPLGELLVMEPEDPDSWLFHTPNLALVDLQARAWDVPVRRVKVPSSDPDGETRALREALVHGGGPVSVGAIASSFQWARVLRAADAVSRRVYAPLWRVAPGRVLEAELQAGLDIRIVQVAAEGLDASLLGQRLTPDLLAALRERGRAGPGLHLAGEGGEYETVVVDAPFFAARIAIDETETETRGALARWAIRRAHLEPKGSTAGGPHPTRTGDPNATRA